MTDVRPTIGERLEARIVDRRWGGPPTEDLRVLAVVFAVKYLAQATLALRPYDRLSAGDLGSSGLLVLATVTAATWAVAAVRPSPALMHAGFILVAVDALLKARAQGPYFYNHFVLEVVVGVLGVLSLWRARRESSTDAWRPMAILAVAVWGIASIKKLLLGTYLTGEYLASLATSARPTPLRALVRLIVTGAGGSHVLPQECCSVGPLTLAMLPALLLILLGAGLVVSELLPVVLVALRVAPARIGVALFALTVLATTAALEFDFGLTNLALASLWTGPKTRRLIPVAAVGFAVGVVL